MRPKPRQNRGNAFLITLVSVVLLGTLTFVVARQMNGSAVRTITTENTTLYANQIIAHAEEMKAVLQQMQALGVAPEDMNFDRPSSGTFNSGDTSRKIYHPAGGGLKEMSPMAAQFWKGRAIGNYIGGTLSTANQGWQIQKDTNVEWTPTASSDVIYSLWGMSNIVCSAINLKITGSAILPTNSWSANALFAYGGGDDINFTTTQCPACNGYPMMCIENVGDGLNVFYSVVLAR